MSHADSVTKVAELAASVAELVGKEIDEQLASGAHVTKGALTESLAKSTGANPGFCGVVISTYVNGREDLESRPGRDGGIYPKGTAKPPTEEAKKVQDAARDFLDSFDWASQLKTKDLATKVGQTTGVDSLAAYKYLQKWLKTQPGIRLVKGPSGGLKRVVAATNASEPTTEPTETASA